MANNRGIKGGQRVMTANDPSTPAPLFNFYSYEVGKKYYNNQQQVDFVTYDGNLYVCTSFDGVTATEPNPDRNEGFLLIVKKGEDGQQGVMGLPGIDGSTPEIRVKFEGKRLVIYDATTQTRLTSSPELVGPTWKPVQQDNKITWRLDDGTSTPAAIDLDELRPKEEHPVLLRLNSDNTKRSDEEGGPGYYIQWKREGNQEWTDLMSISELMNIALAGVTFWMADDEHGATDSNGQPIQRLHVGHKQVVRATYDASKLGNRRIADVELGEILFDAGEIPFPDFTEDINALNTFLCDLQGDLEVLRELIPLDYVKTVNGHLPVNGDVQLTEYYDKETSDGRYLRSVKQLNGQSLAGTGGLWIKTVNNQPLLTNDPAGGNVNVVGSIQIGNGTPITPDPDGIAHLPAYSSSDPTGGITREEADDLYQPKGNYLKGVKVNGTTYNNPNSSGIVDLGSIGGGTSPVDTSDCIKAITINNERKTPDNGEVSFTISVGGTSLFDVRLHQDRYLQKTTDGEHWDTLLDINTIGGLTEAQVKTLIGKILEGITEYIPSEYERTPGHNYFIRINDLSGYATQLYVNNKINEALSQIGDGNITVETFRPFSLYTRTATSAAPTKPGVTAWKWYPNIDNMLHDASKQNPTAQDDDVVAGWSNNIPNATSQLPYLWQAWNVFSSVDGTNQGVEWDGPCPMFGEDGQDGKDGSDRKQIYKLCETYDYFIENRNSLKPSGVGPNVPSNWTAVETGISEQNKLEIYCYSEYDGNTKQWSAWQGPYIWSMWGENGADGSGIEYIFFQQDSGTIASGNNPHNLSAEFTASNTYQTPDFQPNSTNTNGVVSGTWTDEPSGVDSDHKFEFACIRKYDGETKKWGAFSEPKVWSHYGRDAVDLTNDYLIVPTFNDVTKTPEGNGYIPMGTLKFEVYKNGVRQSGEYYGSSNTSTVAAYLGGLSDGQFLEGTLSNRVYTIDIHKNNKNMNVTWNDQPFIQILWYENNKQGKILDSAIVPVIIPGQNGSSQSLDGTVLRVSNYDSNGHYLNGEVATNGIYYLDVVKYNGDYYKCLTSNTSATPTDNSGNVNAGWELFAIRSDSAFNTLLAQSAYIQDLTAKQVVITDTNNQIVAGMASGTAIPSIINPDNPNSVTNAENVRIWAGSISNGNLQTAPFRVTNDGHMYASKAVISNSAIQTISNTDYEQSFEMTPGRLKIEHENTTTNDSAGITVYPSSEQLGDRTGAVLEVWQDTTGPALGVDGILKHRSGLFAGSITNVSANSQTYNINSNLVIVTHTNGGTSSGLYSTAIIPSFGSTSNLNGVHITFLRTSTGVCKIQAASGQMVYVNGTNAGPVNSFDFTSNRVDIVYLENSIYVWQQ